MAQRIAALILGTSLTLAFTACEKKSSTPAWSSAESQAGDTRGSSKSAARRTPRATGKTRLAALTPGEAASTEGLRFISYNVENWLTMERVVNRQPVSKTPKPDAEKHAVLQILLQHMPDVVGLCEIGEASDLTEIQQALKAAGLDLPHSHYAGGADPVRHLGLLSRFPLRIPEKPAETQYRMRGQSFAMSRGILDATLMAHGKAYRLLGVHLKSKREVEGLDQEEMRVQEARLLRRHVDAIFKSDAAARLVVYGDFNDSRPSVAFKTITGNTSEPGYLTTIPFKDSRGEAWTHYWEPYDIYSRFDYVAVSAALKPEVDWRACRILEDAAWADASDHRPVMAVFR